MKKLSLYISFIFIFLVHDWMFAQGAEDGALERFINQFEARYKGTLLERIGFENPWKPYIERPFYEGLSLQNQKLYLELQESGDCFSVIHLDLIGFLKLYPFLTRAFERKDIRANFERTIAYRHSEGARRCDALWSGRRASSENNNIEMQKAIILPLKKDRLYSGPFSRSKVLANSNLDFPRRKKENALMKIYYLAICKDYMPAIRDLEEYSKKKQINLTHIDRTYLSIRSAELGMNGVASAQLYKILNNAPSRNGFKNQEKRSIEIQLFGSIEMNFQTYYAKWCGPL